VTEVVSACTGLGCAGMLAIVTLSVTESLGTAAMVAILTLYTAYTAMQVLQR